MTHAHSTLDPADIWPAIRSEAETLAVEEPLLAPLLTSTVLAANSATAAMAKLLCPKLATHGINARDLEDIFILAAPVIDDALPYDLLTIRAHDPAASCFSTPFLFFKGLHAIQVHRVAHVVWQQGRKPLALFLQNRVSDLFGVDIHPAARIGKGVMMDHATGIVIGETAVVEDNVLFWHGVTLGGRGTTAGDRHPKVRKGAWLGAQSTILGAIEIGENARIAAGSIVVKPVAAGVTVTGAAAKPVGT